MTRCQNAIQGCQSALNCHDCTLFETWADLDRNVKAVLDLSCNVEPVTMSDLVCHLPREMVNHLSEHGLIRAGESLFPFSVVLFVYHNSICTYSSLYKQQIRGLLCSDLLMVLPLCVLAIL